MKNEKAKIGLFFGSFNPIHTGHLMIANYMVEFTDVKKVWFIISPHNPLKDKTSLLEDYHRLAMANLALEDDQRFKVSNIEFHLSVPSYTIDTLTYLREKYPDTNFVIIAGQDNLPDFHKWKNIEQLLELHEIYVSPRPHVPESKFDKHPHIHLIESPLIEISSSFIRKAIKERKDIRYFLPEKVWKYLKEMHFFE